MLGPGAANASAAEPAALQRLMDAQNRVAALDQLAGLGFNLPPHHVEAEMRELRSTLAESGGAAGGPGQDAGGATGALLAEMKRVDAETEKDIRTTIEDWLARQVKEHAHQTTTLGELQKWQAHWHSTWLKGQGLKALGAVRSLESLPASLQAERVARLRSALAAVHGAQQQGYSASTEALVRRLVEIEKERKYLEARIQWLGFVSVALQAPAFYDDPVGASYKKAKELAAEFGKEQGCDVETFKRVNEGLDALVKSGLAADEKVRAIGRDTNVTIPESVRKTARLFAVASAGTSGLKDLNDSYGFGGLLDYYAEAMNLPWQFAQKAAPMFQKPTAAGLGWRGTGIWAVLLEKEGGLNGVIEADEEAAVFGVRLALRKAHESKPDAWFLGLDDSTYAPLTEEQRLRLLSALANERIINAPHDGSEYVWSRLARTGGRLFHPLDLLLDAEHLSDNDRRDAAERIRKVAKATGLTPEQQLALARGGSVGVRLLGKVESADPDDLALRARARLERLGAESFIAGALGKIPADARQAYEDFRAVVAAGGRAWDRLQLQRMFSGWMGMGRDRARLAETIRRVRLHETYEGITLGVSRIAVGSAGAVARGAQAAARVMVIVDGLAPKAQVAARIELRGPAWLTTPEPQTGMLRNGVAAIPFQVNIPADAPQGRHEWRARVTVDLPTGRTVTAEQTWEFNIEENAGRLDGLKARAERHVTVVEFRCEALAAKGPRDSIQYRLESGPSAEGPWKVEQEAWAPEGVGRTHGAMRWTAADRAELTTGQDHADRAPWYRVVRVARDPNGGARETVSAPLAPGAPEVVVEIEGEELPPGQTAVLRHWPRVIGLGLRQAGHHARLNGAKHAADDGLAVRHAWTQRQDRLATVRLPFRLGGVNLKITAVGPGGMTAERLVRLEHEPAEAGELRRRAAVIPEETDTVVEGQRILETLPEKVRQADEAIAHYARILAVDPRHSDANAGIWMWQARRLEWTERMPQIAEENRVVVLDRIADAQERAGLWREALASRLQYREGMRWVVAREQAWIDRGNALRAGLDPGYTPDADAVRAEKEKLAAKADNPLADETRFCARAAGDFETLEFITELQVARAVGSGQFELAGRLLHELAEAAAELTGDRAKAAALWLRGRDLVIQSYTRPEDRTRAAAEPPPDFPWWPEGGTPPVSATAPGPAMMKTRAEALARKSGWMPPPDRPQEPISGIVGRQGLGNVRPDRDSGRDRPGTDRQDAAELAAWLQEADTRFAQGDIAAARPLYERAVTAQPGNPAALVGLARCQNLEGDLAGALARYREVERVAPGTPGLRAWMGEILAAQGDLAQARQVLLAELRLQPGSAWAESWLGSVELAAGNQTAARAHFQRAVQMNPAVVAQRFLNANWMARQNQAQRALFDALAVIWMDPGHAGGWFAAGDGYARTGQAALAVQAYEQYLRLNATGEWAAKARAEISRLRGGR